MTEFNNLPCLTGGIQMATFLNKSSWILCDCNLVDKDLEIIAECIDRHMTVPLEELYLCGNEFTHIRPLTANTLKTVRILDLCDNHISDVSQLNIPAIQELYLGFNNLCPSDKKNIAHMYSGLEKRFLSI